MTRKFRVKCWYGESGCSITDFDDWQCAFRFLREQKKAMPRWYHRVEMFHLMEQPVHTYVVKNNQVVVISGEWGDNASDQG